MILNFHTHSKVKEEGIVKFYNADLRNMDKDFLSGDYRCSGIHPWWIEEFSPLDKEKIRRILLSQSLLCIGEVGLDRSLRNVSFEKQVEFFNFQLELAIERNDKYIIIHCVKAYQEILNSVREIGYLGKLIFHDYNGNLEMTKKLIERGDFFSYGSMLFKENSKGFKSLNIIPLDRLFIETDDQTTFSILDAYNKASKSLNVPLNLLKKKCMDNFLALLS